MDNHFPEPTHKFANLANYYGMVEIFERAGRYYWSLDGWGAEEEIPEYLYRALVRFAQETDQ